MFPRTLRHVLPIGLLLTAAPVLAQREGYSYLSYAGPEVSLVSTAEDDAPARPNTPILAGDRLSTGPGSRSEAILADGNVLRVDVRTNLRFDRLARTYESEDDRNAIYLERGAVSLEHRWSTTRELATRIDTDDATILFPDKGLLRVETGRRGTEIYVASGRAEIHARSGKTVIRGGQYAFVSGDAEVEVDWLDEPRDGFTRFVQERRARAEAAPDNAYVPADYAYDYAAGDLEAYGTWVTVGGTACWCPAVGSGWRPYASGYWRWSPSGLTWVSYEPWGWLPYHYGSWFWDLGYGWCWRPGVYFSPAWVYWSYTPSWVGWCPIGYYGGFYGGYYGGDHGGHPGGPYPQYRSQQRLYGPERGTLAYPHLRGHVDVTRVDPRGWSYASLSRLGSRFDVRRDILGQENVAFRPGERALVVTTPLRIDRGRAGSVTTVVQDAVRRIPLTEGAGGRGGSGASDDLTPVFRREANLATSTQETLRRSFVSAGRDPGYRPVPAEQLAAPRREAAGASASGVPARGGDRGPGAPSSPTRGTETAGPGRETSAGTREPWRDGAVAGDTRATTGGGSTPRRDPDPPLGGGFGRDGSVRGDDGWRSPGAGGTTTGPTRTFLVPSRRSAPAIEGAETPGRSGTREPAPEAGPTRSEAPSAPRRDAPADPEAGSPPPARRDVPAPRADEGWRGSDTPSRGSRPSESSPSPRYEPPARASEPPTRSYEAPRSAPAPRAEAPPSRSYDAPRSAPAPRQEAPPSRSYDAPRSAPAPRSEAPPARSYEAPRSAPAPRSEAPSSAPPPSRSSDAPPRSGSPRG
jgi:hypothetical protein